MKIDFWFIDHCRHPNGDQEHSRFNLAPSLLKRTSYQWFFFRTLPKYEEILFTNMCWRHSSLTHLRDSSQPGTAPWPKAKIRELTRCLRCSWLPLRDPLATTKITTAYNHPFTSKALSLYIRMDWPTIFYFYLSEVYPRMARHDNWIKNFLHMYARIKYLRTWERYFRYHIQCNATSDPTAPLPILGKKKHGKMRLAYHPVKCELPLPTDLWASRLSLAD